MGERIADSELEWHATQVGVVGSLARALAAERAAHRELRERLLVLSDAASVSGLPHCITYETAGGYCQACWVCALKDLLAALVGRPEGARDGDNK